MNQNQVPIYSTGHDLSAKVQTLDGGVDASGCNITTYSTIGLMYYSTGRLLANPAGR